MPCVSLNILRGAPNFGVAYSIITNPVLPETSVLISSICSSPTIVKFQSKLLEIEEYIISLLLFHVSVFSFIFSIIWQGRCIWEFRHQLLLLLILILITWVCNFILLLVLFLWLCWLTINDLCTQVTRCWPYSKVCL